ncbi:uncharacterized [Tachysurus ichikawai]
MSKEKVALGVEMTNTHLGRVLFMFRWTGDELEGQAFIKKPLSVSPQLRNALPSCPEAHSTPEPHPASATR